MKNIKFKFDYCKNNETRESFNTTLNSEIISQLKYIKENTGIPISKMIEASISQHLQDQESFDKFMNICREYDGFN